MLLFLVVPMPRSVFVVPLLWAVVGSTAAFQLGVLQDLGLLVAGVARESSFQGVQFGLFPPPKIA